MLDSLMLTPTPLGTTNESSTSHENGRLAKLTLNGQTLDAASLPTAAVRREAETTDAPASSHSRAQNVVGVKVVSALLKHDQINSRLF